MNQKPKTERQMVGTDDHTQGLSNLLLHHSDSIAMMETENPEVETPVKMANLSTKNEEMVIDPYWVSKLDLPHDPKTWTIDEVYKWAANIIKPGHAQKLKTQEIDGSSLLEMTKLDLDRCGLPVGPATNLIQEIEKLKPEPLAKTRVSRRPKLEKMESVVTKFIDEGFSPTNFCSFRKPSVQIVLDKSKEANHLLVVSPAFTGKSALCQLVYDHLLSSGAVAHLLDVANYYPSVSATTKDLSEYLLQELGQPFGHLLASQEEQWFLIDEAQKLYPITKEALQGSYPALAESTPAAELARFRAMAQHEIFWSEIKKALKRHHFIFFSSYGAKKIGAETPTPPSIGSNRETSLAYFQEEEARELLEDFCTRSKLHWIQQSKEGQDFLFDYLNTRTRLHVGFVALILSIINRDSKHLPNLEALQKTLYSNAFFNELSYARGVPAPEDLKPAERNLLKNFLFQETISEENETLISTLLKKGVLIQERDTENAWHTKVPCPLSKELFLQRCFVQSRPEQDYILTLEEFMTQFLEQMSLQTMKQSLSKSIDKKKNRHLSEAFWQHQLSLCGYKLLDRATRVNVEVKKIENTKGTVDFVIVRNGNRTWVVELLVEGQTKDTKCETTGEEHHNRFLKGGKYENFAKLGDYLVVDFRQGTVGDTKATLPNYWIIYYELDQNTFQVVTLSNAVKTITMLS